MDILQKVFPFSFKVKEKDVTSLIVSIIINIIVAAVGSLVLGLLSGIPIIGFLFAFVGGLMDLYAVVGIVLAVLIFLNILK